MGRQTPSRKDQDAEAKPDGHSTGTDQATASGSQLIAVGTLVASIIAPLFNPALQPTLWTRVQGAALAATFELLALWILGQIPTSEPEKED